MEQIRNSFTRPCRSCSQSGGRKGFGRGDWGGGGGGGGGEGGCVVARCEIFGENSGAED